MYTRLMGWRLDFFLEKGTKKDLKLANYQHIFLKKVNDMRFDLQKVYFY